MTSVFSRNPCLHRFNCQSYLAQEIWYDNWSMLGACNKKLCWPLLKLSILCLILIPIFPDPCKASDQPVKKPGALKNQSSTKIRKMIPTLVSCIFKSKVSKITKIWITKETLSKKWSRIENWQCLWLCNNIYQ